MTTHVRTLEGIEFPDTLPTVFVEPLATTGTLYLIEPAHPYAPWDAGIPGSTSTVMPNAAAKQTADLIGSTATADTSVTLYRTAGFGGVSAKAERTAKGALHGILSQANAPGSTTTMEVNLSAAQKNYLWAHRADMWYFSMWHHITRAAEVGAGKSPFAQFTYTNANYLAVMEQAGELPAPENPNYVDSFITNQASVGGSFRSIATDGFTVGFGTPTDLIPARPANWGRNSNWSSGQTGGQPSHILYRAYAENLTVSGRSFAEVKNLDYRAYQQAFGPGGRYEGDTFTNPATLP